MLEVSFKNKEVVLSVASIKVATLHSENIKKLVNTVPALNLYLASLVSDNLATSKQETLSEIEKFEHDYFNLRDEYYGKKSKIRTFTSPAHKKHIQEAINICQSHDVSYKHFIKAQIEGLKRIAAITQRNDHFPSPGHLSTTDAEKRLLEYGTSAPSAIKLTKEEMELPLKRNTKFIKYWDRFQLGDASLEEAQYLVACFNARSREVPAELEDYLKNKINE